MLQMFIQQTKLISALIEVLKSREVLEDDDLDAYGALQSADVSLADETSHGVEVIYRSYAKVFGIEFPEVPDVENR
jgi:hypothetical protein